MVFDVAIIGAGVVGGLTARELSKYNVNICILEKEDDVAMGATKANSAIVHGGFDPVPGTMKAKMNSKGVKMFASLCKELDVPYKNNGSMVVSFSKEQDEELKKLYGYGIENNIDGLSIISGDEARKLEKNLSSEITSALLCTTSGIVCPYELTYASIGNAMDNGATLKTNFEVIKIEKDNDIFKVSSKDETIEARYVINSSGTSFDTINSLYTNETYTVVPKKGEYMLLDKTVGNTVSRTIFQAPTEKGKGILVTPTVDGNLMVGPTSEPTEKDDKTTTSEGLDNIKRVAALSVPCVNYRKVITSFTGVRAGCKESSDFIIQYAKNDNHFVNLIGIESPGLTSAPAIAEYVVDLLKNAGLNLVINPNFNGNRISPRRFSEMSMEEKNEVIKKDKKYGHVVCFCERITEGEVVFAIHQNPPAKSVDAVKRRTRAGMGGCQGGFCAPNITEILARELKINEEEVTKFGKDSYMLLGNAR